MQSQFTAEFDSTTANINRGISDLANAWQIILASAFFALFFSYLYIYLTRKFAGVIIWLCILLVVAGGLFLGYSFLQEAASAQSDTTTSSFEGISVSPARRIQAYQVAGYIFIGLTSLFVLIILALSSRISIAVEVVKEGSRAISDMKFIVFLPLLPMLICGGYVVYWIYGALFIFSISDKVDGQTMPVECLTYGVFHPNTGARTGVPANYSTFEINDQYRPFAAYWVFHGLWTLQVSGWERREGKQRASSGSYAARTPLLTSLAGCLVSPRTVLHLLRLLCARGCRVWMVLVSSHRQQQQQRDSGDDCFHLLMLLSPLSLCVQHHD